MKTLLTFLCTLATLLTAVSISGFALDAAIVVSSSIASGIVGLFASDYRARPDYRLELEPAAVATRSRRAPVRQTVSSPIFASLVVFNTTIA